MTKSCKVYSEGIRRVSGWVFCHMFYHYFGEGTVVIAGEGEDGKDIAFSVSHDWLEANHATKFGVTNEESHEFAKHICECQSPECRAEDAKLTMIGNFFRKGMLPGGPAIALVSACEGKRKQDSVTISRNGFGDTIDELMTFVKWFIGDNRDFWKWPD